MKKLSKLLKESVWGGILDRGTGETIRKEDDVNLLDIDGLFSYVEEKYSDKVCRIDSDIIHGFQGWKNCVVFPFDDDLEITITRFLDTGKIRDIVIMWDKNEVQDSFLRKLNDRFNICLAPRENAYIDIKDKDGSVSNQTYIDLLDFVLENERTDVLIESVWGNVLDRGAGETIRKEDDIISYNGQQMVEYIINNYRINDNSSQPRYYEVDDTIDVPVLIWKDTKDTRMYHTNIVFYDYDNNVIYVAASTYEDTLKKIKSNPEFSTFKYEVDYLAITPKKGDVNNKFLIKVIDFIIDNVDDKAIPVLSKRHMNESVWGSILDRGAGDSIRKEITMEEFKNHLEKMYRFTKKYEDCGFPMISYNQIYTSIGIPGFAVKDGRLGTSYFHLSLNVVDGDGYVLTLSKTAQKLHIFDVLRKEYIMTDCEKSWDYDIKPKEGKVDKEFFITVLDFINANLQSPEESVVEKRHINESIWGDVLDRGAGGTERKEDTFIFNIKDMKLVDLGKDFPVYWADIDLEANGEDKFDWEETEKMIPQIEKTGWRLPKGPNEIYNMFGKSIRKRDEYLHRFWMVTQGNGYKGVISSEETGETLEFISDNPHCVSYWCTDDWVYLSPGGRINFENERCFDVSPDSRYESEFSLIRTNNMDRTRRIKIRLVKDK